MSEDQLPNARTQFAPPPDSVIVSPSHSAHQAPPDSVVAPPPDTVFATPVEIAPDIAPSSSKNSEDTGAEKEAALPGDLVLYRIDLYREYEDEGEGENEGDEPYADRRIRRLMEDHEYEAGAAFLRGRGAIVCIRASLVFQGSAEPDLISFVVAPKNLKDRVQALHNMCGFHATSCGEFSPHALFKAAAGAKHRLITPLPQEEDNAISFAMRAKVANLDADVRLLEMAGGNVAIFDQVRKTQEGAADARVSFLVEHLIPLANITLVVGARKGGKSTLMTQLAVTVACGGGEFCGFAVPAASCNGMPVLVCGEDSEDVLRKRLLCLSPGGKVPPIFAISSGGKTLTEILADIDAMPNIPLVVIDPARKYVVGDEDGSAGVDAFFSSLEDLAKRKGCAVIVVHHPNKKGGTFSSLAEIVSAARGSSVFLDRTRVHIGMMRRRDRTIIGIPSVDGAAQHNMPPSADMCEDEITLTRDPVTMRHERIMGSAAARISAHPFEPGPACAQTDADRVVSTVGRLISEGGCVTRTGANGLFKRRAPELAGLSRRQVEAAVAAALAAGRLRTGPNGLTVP